MTCIDVPSAVLSGGDGQIQPGGVQGWFHGDQRLVDTLAVSVSGVRPTGLTASSDGATADFRAVVRHAYDTESGPTLHVHRRRHVGHDRLVEHVRLTSTAPRDVEACLEVTVTADFAPMQAVRGGARAEATPAATTADGLAWAAPGGMLTVTADPAPDSLDEVRSVLRWERSLGTNQRLDATVTCTTSAPAAVEFAGTDAVPWRTPAIECPDPRPGALVRQGLEDLRGLLLADAQSAGADVFVAAGSPWFLTLFGRDSLWAARMLLPLGTDLALSTLRVLARRQGTRDDAHTEEQPGKILHEVRPGELVVEGKTLPPLYYGTVDATPLFVTLLAEAWQWGADARAVEQLVPHAEACLRWMETQAGDGFIRYVDATGHGLSNQGWKDSDEAVQWADGRLAEAPIALSEVQAYAYQAAVLGARLLEDFGHVGSQHWRDWARSLATRFRDSFWVEDDRGRYPAIALDGRGAAVDSVASNMGHLLGTGLLDEHEATLVAARLIGDDMDSGFGLRTLTRRSPGYSPLSYHTGSVWPHDTAIAVAGLCREGHPAEAAALLRGLVAAAPAFDYRLPELYSGEGATDARVPAPYPAACRPQAWAAAAPLWALVAVLGIDVDVPRRSVRAPARVEPGLGALAVRGLDVGGYRLDVDVSADGTVTTRSENPDLEITS